MGLYIIFTFPELRKVEQVLHVQFETDPKTWVFGSSLQDKTYVGNTVGISLYLQVEEAGITVTFECIVIGF